MGQNSPQHNRAALEAQIRECFGRVVYSTKTHEKDADQCTKKLSRVKWAQILLSGITTGGLITAFFGDPSVNYWAMLGATICSTLQFILNAYTKDVDPGQKAERYKKTAGELWDVRETYLSILTDLCDPNADLDAVRIKRDQLQARLVEIYKTGPRTTNKAYELAGQGLKIKEEMTFSTEEIDYFLPEDLRKKTTSGTPK